MRDGLYDNLVDSLVAKIKALIQTGDMRGQLQCERDLSKRFVVGRATIRRALTVLERDGWISAPNGKKARMILHNVVNDNYVREVSVKLSLIHDKVDLDYMTEKNEFKFEIINEIGVVSENSKGWKKELSRISWSGSDPKYDIRDWSPEHEKMGKGITLTEAELRRLKEIIDAEIAFLDS